MSSEDPKLYRILNRCPDLDDLRSWIARERAEEVLYRLADIMKHCWATSITDNNAVIVEFDKDHRREAFKVEEFLFLIRRLGQLLEKEENDITNKHS